MACKKKQLDGADWTLVDENRKENLYKQLPQR